MNRPKLLFARLHRSSFSHAAWKNRTIIPSNISRISSEYLVKILTTKIYDVAHETPLSYAPNLSNLLNNKIYIKREDTQPVFSFKIRGAYNKIAQLSPSQLAVGVVACSAGNHAQGVAMAASKLNINATIVMPMLTPKIKVEAVRRFGGDTVTVKLHGDNYDEAAAEAKRLVIEKGYTMVHPFDDPDVIAGQGTIGMEIVKGLNGNDLDAIFVCVGGGGLLSGIAAYIKSVRPSVKVIGVEHSDAAGMTASLKAGKVVTLPSVGPFADGAAVRTVGHETFRICNALADEMITVETDEICAAIKLCFNDTRCVVEPAGALAIAGMVKYARKNKEMSGNTFVAISSGANMDFDRLRFVTERADSSETMISVSIPEKPGNMKQMYMHIFPRNVTEISYRRGDADTADVIVSFQAIPGRDLQTDKEEVKLKLQSSGYEVSDFSNNEMAKAHVRHLAGGKFEQLKQWKGKKEGIDTVTNTVTGDNLGFALKDGEQVVELIYRFEFPETPGALRKFLDTLSKYDHYTTISLYHYRNTGHDYGRVLVAMLVADSEIDRVSEFIKNLGYKWYNETDNIAYKQFLK